MSTEMTVSLSIESPMDSLNLEGLETGKKIDDNVSNCEEKEMENDEDESLKRNVDYFCTVKNSVTRKLF